MHALNLSVWKMHQPVNRNNFKADPNSYHVGWITGSASTIHTQYTTDNSKKKCYTPWSFTVQCF